MSLQHGRAARPRTMLALTAGLAALLLAAGCTAARTTPGTTTAGLPALAANSAMGQPIGGAGASLTAVSCVSATTCWAVGTAATPVALVPSPLTIEHTTDGGAKWTPEAATVTATTDLDGISCLGRSFCMAVGYTQGSAATTGAVYVTENGGATWQPAAVPSGALSVADVVCATTASCLAVATNGNSWFAATTADAGAAWTVAGALPAAFTAPGALSCPAPGQCLVAGYSAGAPGHGAGTVAVTHDGGATWTAPALPAGVGLLHGIACPTTQDCVAVGTTSTATLSIALGAPAVLTTADAGQTWTAGAAPGGIGTAFAASCADARHCAAVGVKAMGSPPLPVGAAVTTSDGAVSWQAPLLRYLPVGLTAVDCPSIRLCITVGGDEVGRLSFPAGGAHTTASRTTS